MNLPGRLIHRRGLRGGDASLRRGPRPRRWPGCGGHPYRSIRRRRWRWAAPPATWRSPGELVRVARVELLGLIELGVAQPGRVGSHGAEAQRPVAGVGERRGDVVGVRAVDAVVGDVAIGRRIDGANHVAETRAVGEPAVGLQREVQHHRHAKVAGGERDAEPLACVGERARGDEVAAGVGEHPDLMAVVPPRLVCGHRRADLVAVPARPSMPLTGIGPATCGLVSRIPMRNSTPTRSRSSSASCVNPRVAPHSGLLRHVGVSNT